MCLALEFKMGFLDKKIAEVLLHKIGMLLSSSLLSIQRICVIPPAIVIYSASTLDIAMFYCLLLEHEIKLPPRN